ncbi:adenylate/guanylate cyclase domain-containing protein [soil metagenome]
MSEPDLAVRCGLHTGECESSAVTSAASPSTSRRGSAPRRAGQVLLSSTVKDLVVGSELSFDDRGVDELRGVPGDWRLYAREREGSAR